MRKTHGILGAEPEGKDYFGHKDVPEGQNYNGSYRSGAY